MSSLPLHPDLTPTPAHLRGARGLLGWTQADLAARAGVSLRTVKVLEAATPDTLPAPGRPATIERIVDALAVAGVTLIKDGGSIGVARMAAVEGTADGGAVASED